MLKLKALRESRGLSQQKLAETFHMTQQSIHKYENDLAEPDIAALTQFARFFHVSIDYLVSNTESLDDAPVYVIEGLPPSDREVHHLVMYRNLSDNMQKHIDGILEDLQDKKNKTPAGSI
ncbi:MAG: helix-turn-helix transcriptional regulator [bacterium]|nr:helix-turn-helix transcriptional regulator [bacterium]